MTDMTLTQDRILSLLTNEEITEVDIGYMARICGQTNKFVTIEA